MPYDNANELVDERTIKIPHCFRSINVRDGFNFDSVQLSQYRCHKINFERGGSYIDSPDWTKKKKTTINPKNKDDKCF